MNFMQSRSWPSFMKLWVWNYIITRSICFCLTLFPKQITAFITKNFKGFNHQWKNDIPYVSKITTLETFKVKNLNLTFFFSFLPLFIPVAQFTLSPRFLGIYHSLFATSRSLFAYVSIDFSATGSLPWRHSAIPAAPEFAAPVLTT